MAFPTTPLLDNFNRANSDPVSGNWARATGVGTGASVALFNNEVKDSMLGTAASYWLTQLGANQEVYATAPSPVDTRGGQGLLLSWDPAASTGYMVFWQTTALILRSDSVGSYVVVKDVPASLVSGDVLGGSIVGNLISLYINGSLITTYTGTTFTNRPSYIGVYCGTWSNNLDNFGGGTITLSSDQPFPPLGRGATW